MNFNIESELKRVMDNAFGQGRKPDLSPSVIARQRITPTNTLVIAGQNEGRGIRAVEKPAANITSL